MNEAPETGPLIVVGLPRSGSSLISDLFTQAGYYYVFDDLYLRRRADEIGAGFDPLSEDQLDQLLFFLGWQIRARMRFKPYSVPKMTEPEVDKFSAALKESYLGKWPSWPELQYEWLYRLSQLNGCKDWGYNMPGAFLETDMLMRLYPSARILFLFRSPDSILASYKFMKKGHVDGDPDRYHPFAYALYWRKCVDAYRVAKTKMPHRVHAVCFEELISDGNAVMSDIADFFDLPEPAAVSLPPPNTSFERKRMGITGMEAGLLKRILNGREAEFGYKVEPRPFKFGDVWDIAWTTVKFSRFQVMKVAQQRGRLMQMLRFLNQKRG